MTVKTKMPFKPRELEPELSPVVIDLGGDELEPPRVVPGGKKLTVDDLSPDQLEAYEAVRSWLGGQRSGARQVLSLAGYAGTGKSTVVSVLAHELPSPLAFCAFTGKASSVLGRKLAASGIATTARTVRIDPDTGARPFEPRPYCGTIHGLVYRPCEKCMEEEAAHDHSYGKQCKEPRPGEAVDAVALRMVDTGTCLGCDPPPPKVRKDQGPCPKCGDARYLRRDELDRQYKLIVVDEASMVSDDILETLLRHNIPILAVGDHGQLPPVRGQGSLMKTPDLRLEQIHRQAAGSPIIGLSAAIRTRGDIDDRLEDGKAFTILPRRKLGEWIAEQFPARLLQEPLLRPDAKGNPTTAGGILGTVLVSWTNKLRVTLNYDVRESLGLADSPPTQGEAVICLKNKPPVYNGMRGVLTEDSRPIGQGDRRKHAAYLDFAEDGIRSKDRVLMSELQFFAEKTIDYDAATEMKVRLSEIGELYDFSYGVTCHKMQGSQAPQVAVVVEPGLVRMGREDRMRWLYTAVTRASERLVIFR